MRLLKPLALPAPHHGAQEISIYTAEPGTPHEQNMKLLASLAASRPQQTTGVPTTPDSGPRRSGIHLR